MNLIIEMEQKLRAPIGCVLGHVDAGKTSLLDCLRTSHVADGEAGGITQQIGATFFPLQALEQMIESVAKKVKVRTDIPGLLMLDTPGHASFTNLRSRGTAICDLAIVVVDFHDGLKPQTIESLELLKKNRTPFVVAVNKIDRIYGWKSKPEQSVVETLKQQNENVRINYETRMREIIAEFACQERNAELYYRNKNFKSWVSIVPISAKTGDGIPDLLALVMQLTQKLMTRRLTAHTELHAVVMEVKKTAGYGTTLDVILIDGTLNVGDMIVVAGLNEIIVTHIRALLVPHSLQELRVKGKYDSVDSVSAAQCLKIAGSGLDDAVAGMTMYVAKDTYDIQEYTMAIRKELSSIDKYPTSAEGVYMKASTLGSLQALHGFLTEQNIEIRSMGLGSISRNDIIKASAVEYSHKYAVILAFDLKFTDPELVSFAHEQKVTVLTNDVMYQLVDDYREYLEPFLEIERQRNRNAAVHPCKMELRREWIFHASSPMILGAKIQLGGVCVGTELITESGLSIGKILEIKVNGENQSTRVVYDDKHRQSTCKRYHYPETECSLKIDGRKQIIAGRHFLKEDTESVYTSMSRESIDALKSIKKEAGEKLSQEELKLIVFMKKLQKID